MTALPPNQPGTWVRNFKRIYVCCANCGQRWSFDDIGQPVEDGTVWRSCPTCKVTQRIDPTKRL